MSGAVTLRMLFLSLAGLPLAVGAACRDTTRSPAPTAPELKAATYHGFDARDTVTLVEGRWEGPPFVEGGSARPTITLVPDFRVTGDLDGDGQDDAVVALTESTGGSGTWVYLAMMARRDGRVVNLATHRLGDRVQIRDARIEDGMLYADVLRAGPDDAACCPGELASLGWELRDGRFNTLVVSGTTARFGPETLGGVEWVLRRWDVEDAVTAEQAPTLQVQGNRASGNAGCNVYRSVLGQEGPGEMRFGTFTLTRMMCPAPAMEVEARFLQALEETVKVGFLAGQLAVSYLKPDGTVGTMVFGHRALPQ